MSPHTRRGQKTLSNQAFSSAFTWALGIPSGSSGLHSKLVSHLPGPHVRYCEQWHWLKPDRSLPIISGVLLASSSQSQGPTFTAQAKAKVTSVTPNAFLQLISVKKGSFSQTIQIDFPLISHWPELVLKLACLRVRGCAYQLQNGRFFCWGRGDWGREEVLLAKTIICGNSINSTTHSTVPNRGDGNLNGKFF